LPNIKACPFLFGNITEPTGATINLWYHRVGTLNHIAAHRLEAHELLRRQEAPQSGSNDGFTGSYSWYDENEAAESAEGNRGDDLSTAVGHYFDQAKYTTVYGECILVDSGAEELTLGNYETTTGQPFSGSDNYVTDDNNCGDQGYQYTGH